MIIERHKTKKQQGFSGTLLSKEKTMKKMILFAALCVISATTAFGALPVVQPKPAQFATGLHHSRCSSCVNVTCNVYCDALPYCCVGGCFALCGQPEAVAVCAAIGAVACADSCENSLNKIWNQRKHAENNEMHRN